MSTSDPAEILLQHNRWGTRQIIEACRNLSHEQCHQQFEIGLGSVHDTVLHILSAMRGWTDLLAERESTPRLEDEGEKTPEELLALLDETQADFEKHTRGLPVDQPFTRERGGREYTFTRGQVLTHVMTHGVHHRAQCVNMLRHLGVEKLPDPSVLMWMLMSMLPPEMKDNT